ncbi:705_t:CDS:2, partial [Racocetra fulgida]
MAGGKKFKPKEPYTHRLKKILEEYPDSSQVLREILQNSDDAQSTEQVFILDHNTYRIESLLMPGLNRFQGPALLSKNNTKFNDDDFTSLENLADSEKQGQYDKIGEMGVGFNSIYHLCDSCSFITNDNFVILDPHEWCYEGGHVYDNFIEDNLSQEYPDQFYPFKNLGKLSIPCDGSFQGTIFRYPLRTKKGSKESKISKTTYQPDQVLEMFKTFFEKDSVNCLLFLRYIEYIEFYELKIGETEPELIYRISLKDARKIRKERQMIVKKIAPMMKDLKENKLEQQRTTLYTSYRVSLVQCERGVVVEDSSWFIVNMLGDLHDANRKFPDDFGERLGTVPIVGLATKLNLGQNGDKLHGGLFCFFPLHIDTPFRVSINGHFAVTNNRRNLWSGIDKDLFLKQNKDKWEDKLTRQETFELFNYLLNDENDEILEGLKMIPLANGTFKTISIYQRGTITYICPDSLTGDDENDPREIFKDQLDKLIAKDIPCSLLSRLCDKVTTERWNFNIEMLTAPIIANMAKNYLNHPNSNKDEIDMETRFEWINQLWNYLCNKFNEKDLISFEDIHLIPTKQNTLRKLKTESVLSSLNTDEAYNLDPPEAELFIKYLSHYLYITPPLTKDHIEIIKRLPIFKEVDKDEIISLRFNEQVSVFLLPRTDEKEYGQIIAPKKFRFLDATSTDTCYLLEKIIKIQRLSQAQYWLYCVIPYLKDLSADIVVEKLFERLPTLFRLDSSLNGKLSKLSIVPCGTIRMVQGEENLDTIKCKPIDLYDPLNPKIAQLFFDDEKVFPVEKFSNPDDLYYHLLKRLGIKTSLSSIDIIKRIETYVKRQKMGNNINEVYNKSLNLLIYIDENWISLSDKNKEFLSMIASKWIPTINKCGNKSFSCSSECRDKKDEYLVSLALPILDYKITSALFREHLEWKRYPCVKTVLSQMKLCSTMPKDNLNIKNQPRICEAIYKYIDEALSASDEQSKQEVKELREGLKNIKWIFCEGDFYATKNVVFDLSTNFGKELPIVQLPSDYRNNFSKVFKSMGVREKVDISDFIDIIGEIAREADNKPLTDKILSKTIKILDQIGKECNKFKKEGNPNDWKNLFIPSTDAILVSFEEIKFDDRVGISNEEKENCKLSHSKISIALAKELGIQMLSEMFTKGSEIDFEDYEQSEPLTTRIKSIITRRFSIYIDERPFHENDHSSLLSEEMYNWQGPAVWIYNDATFDDKDFSALIKLGVGSKSSDESKIGRFGIGITTSYHLTDVLSFVSGEQIAFLDPHAKFLPIRGNSPKRPRGIKPYLAIEDCNFNKSFNGTLFRLPLRSIELSKKSLISRNSVNPKDILEYLRKIKGIDEILFLRNIGIYSIYHIDKDKHVPQLIWETKIQNLKDIENIRSKAHGGVAAILARSDNESLNNPLDLTDPPDLDGKEYAYVSCNGSTNLGVHINGNFSLTRDRIVILQPNDNINGKWNKYILLEVLPSLHVKLLEKIAEIDYEHFKKSNI